MARERKNWLPEGEMSDKQTNQPEALKAVVLATAQSISDTFRTYPATLAARHAERILFEAEGKYAILSSDGLAAELLEQTNGIRTPLPSACLKLFLLEQLLSNRRVGEMDFPLIETLVGTVDLLVAAREGELTLLLNKIEKRSTSPDRSAKVQEIMLILGRIDWIRQIIFQKVVSRVARSNGDPRAAALKTRFCPTDPQGT